MSDNQQKVSSQQNEEAVAQSEVNTAEVQSVLEPQVEASDKVAEQQDDAKATSEATPEQPTTDDKPADEAEAKVDVVEKQINGDSVEPVDNKEESEVEEGAEASDDQVDSDKQTGEQVVTTNGDSVKTDEKESVEESNGLGKRKVETSEVVDDEKSPKKAKVVDDGDQAKVEETAA